VSLAADYLCGLALALRQYGLTVTTIRIGFVDTRMAKADRNPAMVSPRRRNSASGRRDGDPERATPFGAGVEDGTRGRSRAGCRTIMVSVHQAGAIGGDGHLHAIDDGELVEQV
jgi:hypothetical protein